MINNYTMRLCTVFLFGAILAMNACGDSTPSKLGLKGRGLLTDCPYTPNCVCSDQAESGRTIEPLRLSAEPNVAWQALLHYVSNQPRMRIVEQRDDYLRIESRTRLLRFVDDVEFHLRPDQRVIAMRSASRVGYSDLGTNRNRLEAIRAALSSTNVVRPAG